MTGSIAVASESRLIGADVNALWNVSRGSMAAINLLGGFRTLNLRESISITENLSNIAAGGGLTFGGETVVPGQSVQTFDKFGTDNSFYGGQLGTRMHFQSGRIGLDIVTKAALGVTQQVVTIEGSSVLNSPANTALATLPGGVLAASTNIGRHYRSAFGVIPEGNIDMTYAFTDRLLGRVGYTFIYWNSVVRPGNQIDRTVNPGVVPTDPDFGLGNNPARPGVLMHTSSYWAQGLNFGLEFRY